MEQCLRLHIPADVDLVLMESAANMCSLTDCQTGMASVERMLRQLLSFAKRPAIVFVHAYPFWIGDGPKSWMERKKKHGGKKKGHRGPTGLPILTNLDLSFQFHQQWGHATNEHMVDELAKYCESVVRFEPTPPNTLAFTKRKRWCQMLCLPSPCGM